jgi:hypothetical protein
MAITLNNALDAAFYNGESLVFTPDSGSDFIIFGCKENQNTTGHAYTYDGSTTGVSLVGATNDLYYAVGAAYRVGTTNVAHTLAVTTTANHYSRSLRAVAATGVHQTTPLRGSVVYATNGGGVNEGCTIVVPSAVGDVVMVHYYAAGAGDGDATVTGGAKVTGTWERTDGAEAGIITAAGTTNVTITVTPDPGFNSLALVGYSLQPASGGSTTPTISLSSSAVNFAVVRGGTTPSSTTVTASNVGAGTLTATLGTVTYSAAATGWLTSSVLSNVVTLQPNTTNLDPGTYTATVPVVDATASNTPQNITVTYTVSASSDLPEDWSAVGAAALTVNVDTRYTRYGGQSIRVQASAGGQGVRTAAAAIEPTTDRPYFSGYMSFWLVSGQVRLELVADDGTVWPDVGGGKAWSSQTAIWVDLGLAGLDLTDSSTALLRLVADGGPAEFYLDAAQLTQTAAQEPLIEGSGATQLWQEANRQLLARSQPLVRVDIDVLDLAVQDAAVWSSLDVATGDSVRIADPDLNVSATTRVLQIVRDAITGLARRLTLSSRPEDLTDALVRPRPGVRNPRTPVEPAAGPRLTAVQFQGFTDSSGGSLTDGEQIRANFVWEVNDLTTDDACDLWIYQGTTGIPSSTFGTLQATNSTPAATSMPYRLGVSLDYLSSNPARWLAWRFDLRSNGHVVDTRTVTSNVSITGEPDGT